MTQREGAYTPESISLRCDPTLGHCAGKTQFSGLFSQLTETGHFTAIVEGNSHRIGSNAI